jgi:hypothetical protein
LSAVIAAGESTVPADRATGGGLMGLVVAPSGSKIEACVINSKKSHQQLKDNEVLQ